MKLGLNQSARLEQRLVQSPQMIQAMQILQLPLLDLEARVQQELVENPFLEQAEVERSDEPVEVEPSDAEIAGVETMLDELERYERDFSDGRARPNHEESDRKFEAMQNTPDDTKSLAEDLMEELAFLELTERQRAMAEFLLYSLDDRGYLEEPLEEIAAACNSAPIGALDDAADVGANGDEDRIEFAATAGDVAAALEGEPVTVEELAQVLAELRSISHPALGARDLKESLQLQIEALGLNSPVLSGFVADHLDDLEQNRLPRIAKALSISIEEVKAAVDILRTLDPTPGTGYGVSRAAVITPEVIVEEIDGEYDVRLDRQRIPQLTLSPAYREFLRKAQKGDGVREWVKKRLESARWFIDAVQQRESTLLRIARVIFTHQRDFLDKGVRALKPLRMQEVADEVGVHISTVSRAVSGKHAQTPRGIHPLKFFFTGGTMKASGEVASQASIKQRIADLVAQEDGDHPLSDDQIAALLEERDNVKIARRTVTKYRKAMSIPASSQRKQF